MFLGRPCRCWLSISFPLRLPMTRCLGHAYSSVKEQGEAAFEIFSAPRRCFRSNRGVGRLIRTEHDRGICLLGDRRLAQMGYGRKMLAALPKFRQSQSLSDAAQFAKTLDP